MCKCINQYSTTVQIDLWSFQAWLRLRLWGWGPVQRCAVPWSFFAASLKDWQRGFPVNGRLSRKQYVSSSICQFEDFEINQIWFCEVVLTMPVGRIVLMHKLWNRELASSPLCLCLVFMTYMGVKVPFLSLFSQPVMSAKRYGCLPFLTLDIRAEESFPLLGQLPQMWNVIRGRFHDFSSSVYVCVYGHAILFSRLPPSILFCIFH